MCREIALLSQLGDLKDRIPAELYDLVLSNWVQHNGLKKEVIISDLIDVDNTAVLNFNNCKVSWVRIVEVSVNC